MANVNINSAPIKRYYNLAVGATAVGLPAERLTAHNGELVQHAVCRITGASVRMGVLSLINPTSTVGFPLAANDVLELTGHHNIKNALFIQDSGAATIQFVLS